MSTAAHGGWLLSDLVSIPQSVQINDFEGEAAIPIDIIEQGAIVAEPPPPAPEKPDEPKEHPAPAPAAARIDAGAIRDAGADAPADAGADAKTTIEAGLDAEAFDAGEAGAKKGDPQALLTASGAVQADVVYVTVVINAIEIRNNPASARLTALLRSIPDWDDFMHGTEALIDPVRDTDWIMISGPSLRNSSEDVITLHYAIADAKVDQAVGIVASHYAGKGGPYDAGVSGTRAWMAHADYAERVIERPRSHVLLIVPPKSAAKAARTIIASRSMPTNIMPGVATYVRVIDPHHALPRLIPEGVVEMRLKVVSRGDGGADIDIDGDCKDAETAARAASEVRRTIREQNGMLVQVGTKGLLNRVEVTSEGARMHVHVAATPEQIDATIASVQVLMPPPAPR